MSIQTQDPSENPRGRIHKSKFLLAQALALVLLSVACPAQASMDDVRLVLQITVDQLRGDLPLRFKKRFGKGGFRYLMDKGTYFVSANYIHADTETAPGHATLVTGGTPQQHGITASEWWDRRQGKVIYSVEDGRYPIIDSSASSTPGSSSKTKGRAPSNLLSTTIADEVYLASEHRSKIFAVSGKDRSAIIPGGRKGKAFWLSNGRIVTSSYYYKKPPDWLDAFNNKKLADTYQNKKWTLLQDRSKYWRIERDDRPYEGRYKHLDNKMPKSFGNAGMKDYYNCLAYTYVNDSLVLEFAKHLIETQKLGQHDVLDYLSVSFSSTDAIGHIWGIGSLEAEDNLLRVDRNLAQLFSLIDRKIGLDKTLIVLSADHGASEIAEYIQEMGFPSRRMNTGAFLDHVNKALRKKFNSDRNLIAKFLYPYLYLDHHQMKRLDIDREDVEEEAARAALAYPGIAYAITRSQMLEGEVPIHDFQYRRALNNFNPQRSGDIHLIAEQYLMLVHWPWNGKPGMHGTVWTYDTYVPIMFAGPGIKRGQRVARMVGPQDVASTVAAYLGIKPPSGSIGKPLVEVFK